MLLDGIESECYTRMEMKKNFFFWKVGVQSLIQSVLSVDRSCMNEVANVQKKRDVQYVYYVYV